MTNKADIPQILALPALQLQTRRSCVLDHNTCQMIPGIRFSFADMAHRTASVIFHKAQG